MANPTTVSYGDNGIFVLSPSSTSAAPALLLGNDAALSNAIDYVKANYLSAAGGNVATLNVAGGFTAGNNATLVGNVYIKPPNYVAGTIPYLTNTNSGIGIKTNNNNVIDDGSGNMTITGTLTLPISSTAPLHSLTTASAGSSTAVHVDTLFAGTSGSTSYTITDLVTLLKSAGILKA